MYQLNGKSIIELFMNRLKVVGTGRNVPGKLADAPESVYPS